MKTVLGKKWNDAAKAYSEMAKDRKADAYEFDINFPSILNLFPEITKGSVLDVGTGSGDFIPEFEKFFENVEGTDVSPNMVDIVSKNYPKYKFRVWDLEEKFPGDQKYDVIVCKLVLMFVEDLDNVANEFKRILNPGGSAIISVVHPIYWYNNFLLNKLKVNNLPEFNVMKDGYYSTGKEVLKFIGGNKDLEIGFIHRTLSDYINPFTQNGLLLTKIDEPRITPEFVKDNPRFADRLDLPMRLNFRIDNIL